MAKQEFYVTMNIVTDIEPPMTEATVRKQLEKFLKGRSLTEGLAMHGKFTIRVINVAEPYIQREVI